MNRAPERSDARPLKRLAAEMSHVAPTGNLLRGQKLDVVDVECPSGSTRVPSVEVHLADFGATKVTVHVAVDHFREFWVTEWFSSIPVQYAVVKAAVLAGPGVIAVPSDHIAGLVTRDPSSDPEARRMLMHLAKWLKRADALNSRCILIPVPTGKHWALAAVYSPSAIPNTIVCTCDCACEHPPPKPPDFPTFPRLCRMTQCRCGHSNHPYMQGFCCLGSAP